MRIVDMYADLLAKIVDAHPRLLVVTHNALYARRDEEVFLNEAHAAHFVCAVVGVEVARDRLDETAVVVALLDLLLRQHPVVGEIAVDLRVPQPERVDCRIVVADDRHIVRHCHDDHGILVHELEFSANIAHICVSAKLHINGFIRLAVLPRKSVAQPVVRDLDLVAADDLLLEEPVLIADAASVSREAMRRERVDEAGGETTETAVSKPRVRFCLVGVTELEVKILKHFFERFFNAKIDEVCLEQAPQQELDREVVNLLFPALGVLLIRLDPVVRNGLLGSCGDRLVDFDLRQLIHITPEHNVCRRDEPALQDFLHCVKRFPLRACNMILLCQIVHSFSKSVVPYPLPHMRHPHESPRETRSR